MPDVQDTSLPHPSGQRSIAASGMIRAAERHIQKGEYGLALQWLQEAMLADPANRYVSAIIDRVNDIIAAAGRKEAQRNATLSPAPEGDQAHVRRLTVVATQLFERGSYDSALESLMKARELDPSSPYVAECERLLVPALEVLKKKGTLSVTGVSTHQVTDTGGTPAISEYLVRHSEMVHSSPIPQATGKQVESPDAPAPAESRVDMLKRKLEEDRRRREQAMWREASRTPTLLGKRIDPPHEKAGHDHPAFERKNISFFGKLRQGRLLG